jgi:drug/metabolite transporter (DMT)-like permease
MTDFSLSVIRNLTLGDGLLTAGIYIAAKWAIDEIPPWTLCFWRVTIAAAVLAPIVYNERVAIRAFLEKRWLEALMIGSIGLGLSQGLMYTGSNLPRQ